MILALVPFKPIPENNQHNNENRNYYENYEGHNVKKNRTKMF